MKEIGHELYGCEKCGLQIPATEAELPIRHNCLKRSREGKLSLRSRAGLAGSNSVKHLSARDCFKSESLGAIGPTPVADDGPYLVALPCVHRSESPSRQVPCGMCGAWDEERNLYGCTLHVECYLRPIKRQADYAKAMNCNGCRDRETSDVK